MSKKGWDKNLFISASANPKAGSELVRISNSEIQLISRFSRDPRLLVFSKVIDFFTPISLTLGAGISNLVEGGAPLASTDYHIYLSNLGVLGLSATSYDSDGYRTGDPTNLHIGIVHLDGDKECSHPISLCGYGCSQVLYEFPSDIIKSSGASAWYIFSTLESVVMLPGKITVLTRFQLSDNSSDYALYITMLDSFNAFVDFCGVAGLSGNGRNVSEATLKHEFDSVKSLKIEYKWYYNSGYVNTFWGGTAPTDSKVIITRET